MKTDMQVQEDVIAELKWEPSVNAALIGVEVKDGIVTLAGHVDSYAEKHETVRAVQRVAGVKAVAVEIDVALPGASVRHDADIARSAENVLQWTTYLPRDCVKVVVENGWITLTGEVGLEYQKRAAGDAVRHLLGVTGAVNDIVVKPSVSAISIKADIDASLKRRAKADAQGIQVDVDGSDVTLTGVVHSWAERDMVNHSAWGTPGVRNVVDRLLVSNI
ncbi:BON domain-containing protein [Undibacterium terreum]|uniref:Tri-BON domain-containing protein n=1 Tax=Undibacterium terreum TaxID=1224302 RepID=A0A916XC66_9BURK|nr:BON domain-containing protein [Undibacterium terreum]GGC63171.1 tri-BON domain-containing protein [Undibacterium terreum]